MSKLYTKTGDSGFTSLANGQRVKKDHPRVQAYGKIDEVIGWIAVLRSMNPQNDLLFRTIECHLMEIAAALATPSENPTGGEAQEGFKEHIAWIEAAIDQLQEGIPPLRHFILPSGPPSAAWANIARNVCRQAERDMVHAGENIVLPNHLIYINRLSDFLFILARYLCISTNCTEDYWK